ncbi:NAD(P)-dependent oxidoreductase, partial [Bacillus sp. JJ1521]|uniref:NAD(P)-dependent oxidoreductase n=1 Tax=Bacillus sp. JJ1521 TaxID=3122957 RepID=UPI003000E25E
IDMGTCGPSVDIECAEHLKTKGAYIIDAPVGKGTWAAGSGELTILVGGDKEVIKRAEDVLNKLGSQIIHCGSLGSGQVVKLANNLASCVNMAALGELYTLASSKGIEIDILQQALTGTAADSWHLQNSLPRVKTENFEPGFKTRLAHKDLNLISDLGEELGIELPVATEAIKWYQNAMYLGYGEEDWSVIAKAALESSTKLISRR